MVEVRESSRPFEPVPAVSLKSTAAASSRRHEDKKRALSRQMKETAGEVRLRKETSNLFRERVEQSATRLHVSDFNQVIDVDATTNTVDVEGMTSYEKLAAATFAHGVLPAVVPQLKAITIGGAVAGLGIEASSFRYGLAHETVQEIEVLLADGDVVTCTPDNEHSDLFFALPNSYGTLGYALRVKAKTVPAKPYVALTHTRHSDPQSYFHNLEALCGQNIDYIDGVVFAPSELYLTVGRFADSAPYTSDYTYLNIYYRSIRERHEDYLTTLDYIWRWDTDWFWCSRVMFAQNPIVRRLLGKERLNSTFYKKVSDWNNRRRLRQRLRQVLRDIFRACHPGRGHPDHERRRVSRILPARDWSLADLDLPFPLVRSLACVSPVSDEPEDSLREFRILGCRGNTNAARGGTFQPHDREEGS